jgi:hypothetical protein
MSVGKVAMLAVGGALLAPTLLDRIAPAGRQPNGLAVGDPRTVAPGHSAAVSQLQDATLGVPTRDAANVSAFKRFEDICAALVPTKGSVSATSPGFPKLSPVEFIELATAFLRACKAGVDAGAYELSSARLLDVPLLGDIVGSGVGNVGVDQGAAFDLLTTDFEAGTSIDPIPNVTELGAAVREVAIENRKAGQKIPDAASFDATDGLRAVADLANAMDTQGIHFELPGIGDLGNAIVDSAANLPARVGNVVGGALGDVVGSVITSTPVLLGIVGFLVYRTVKA